MRVRECVCRLLRNPLEYLRNPSRTFDIGIALIKEKLDAFKPQNRQAILLENRLKEIYLAEGKIEVRRGPFEGMRYAEFGSTGSSLWPKLAGVYEKELQAAIYDSLQYRYKYILDIGCAEGYYAVGYASKNIADKVYAYDIDENARQMCEKMCRANEVSIETGGWCTPEMLKNFNFSSGKRSLIIADCEGYERELFTPENIGNLENVNLIVEVHDWIQNETPTLDYLIQLFEPTHDYEIIYGVDDYEKAYRYYVEELSDFSIKDRYQVFRENRRRLDEWIYFKARSKGRTGEGLNR